MKAILIDSAARAVREIDIDGLKDMQEAIGGYIEAAYYFPDKIGNVLFVDEEGLLKRQEHFFWFAGRPDQPLAGNGLIVGKELYDAEGEYVSTEDVAFTVEQIASLVRFTDIEHVRAWAIANASEPMATFTYIDSDGVPHTEVIATWSVLMDGLFGKGDGDEDEDGKV